MGKTQAQRIKDFWKWFADHEEELYEVSGPGLPLYHQLVTRIREIDRGLVMDVGRIERDRRELIISADGKEELLPLVMKVEAAAPELEKFRVSVFRPARKGHLNVVMEKKRFETTDIFFKMKVKGGKAEVEVWFIDPQGLDERHGMVARIMLLNMLGEYRYIKRVGKVRVGLIDQEKEYPELQPLIRVVKEFEREFGGGN